MDQQPETRENNLSEEPTPDADGAKEKISPDQYKKNDDDEYEYYRVPKSKMKAGAPKVKPPAEEKPFVVGESELPEIQGGVIDEKESIGRPLGFKY